MGGRVLFEQLNVGTSIFLVCVCKAVITAVIKIQYLNSAIPFQQHVLICSLQRQNGSKGSLIEETSQLSTNNIDGKSITKIIKTVQVSRFKVET